MSFWVGFVLGALTVVGMQLLLCLYIWIRISQPLDR